MSDLAVQNNAIDNAYSAMHSGDWPAARFWAQQAATQFPEREEPWLVLAAVSAPHASLGYLQRAASLNPVSPRVAKAMHWTRQRLARDSAPKVLPPAPSLSILVQKDGQTELAVNPHPAPVPVTVSPRALPRLHLRLRFVLPAAAALLLCLGLAWLIWPGARSSAQAPGGQPGATLPPSAATRSANLASTAAANFISSVTPADDPSIVRSPTMGLALTQVPSATAIPATVTTVPTGVTNTAVPSKTTIPTRAPVIPPTRQPFVNPTTAIYVVQRGDTLASIATKLGVDLPSLVSANHIANPSLISPGLKLTVPSGGKPAAVAETKKHILVNISNQRLYAYDGDKLVFDFAVSTGNESSLPRGKFTILNKRALAWSDLRGFWMPDWMGFYATSPDLENGFHALPMRLNGEIFLSSELNTPATNGCVVLGVEDAHQLYTWADIGTSLIISK